MNEGNNFGRPRIEISFLIKTKIGKVYFFHPEMILKMKLTQNDQCSHMQAANSKN